MKNKIILTIAFLMMAVSVFATGDDWQKVDGLASPSLTINSSGVIVNPATEDKQDDVVTGLTAIETNQSDFSQTTQLCNSVGVCVDMISYEGEESLKVVYGHKETFSIHLDADGISATTAFMLIDLSNTGTWPHTNTDHIVLDWYSINVNPTTAFRGDIEFGFLSSVDDTNGDFNILHTWHMDQQAMAIVDNFDHSSHGIDLESSSMYGPKSSNDVLFQTDVAITGPGGATHNSGDGDMALKITRTAGSVDVAIVVGYVTRDVQ